MQEQDKLRRPILLASAGIATATILYFAFAAYNKHTQESPGLHRSNAVRRSRRRWRAGHAPRDLAREPITEAIRHLHGRIAAHQPYGRYDNQLLFNLAQDSLEEGHYDLLPTNLGPMIRELSESRPFTDFEKEVLHNHVESMFIQNFLIEEFPAGYLIGEDVESLVHAMRDHGISELIVRIMVERFDAGKAPTPVNWDLHEESRPAPEVPAGVEGIEPVTPQGAIEALTGAANGAESDSGWGNDDDESDLDAGESQGMLDLLYHIAEEQAKRDGLVHREVRCDSCGAAPIRGIRYHCANCFNYDLCESCEAQQVHHKNHVFYKIRIPAPLRGHIKQVTPVWYPGEPNAFPSSMPPSLSQLLMQSCKIEKTELDSLYEQFKCIAGHHILRESDPTHLGLGISRKNFDFYFTTTSDDRSPPQNLIYDRIFAFYDINNDDVITFDEFVWGMFNLQNRTRAARVKRMFQGYDLDGDGYVSRRDFLRMLRAYYAWHKELNKETIVNHDELDEDIRDAIHGTQPISAAFGWNEYAAHVSRGGRDKMINGHGDLEINSGVNGVLQNDSDVRGDRARSIGNAAVRGQTRLREVRTLHENEAVDEPVVDLPFSGYFDFRTNRRPGDATEEELMSTDPTLHVYGWPPDDMPERTDIINGTGADVSIEEVMDPVDRARVIYAQAQRIEEQDDLMLSKARQLALQERWKRRSFYLDEEEGMSKPPGYKEPDSSDDEHVSEDEEVNGEQSSPLNATSRRQSMRSRSSSKVRFDDSTIDTDHETRSNASSRSIPMNERWGGFELSEPERDIGKEIIYQTVQQGFNELLDPLFKEKEDKALEAMKTKVKRQKWHSVLEAYRTRMQQSAIQQEQVLNGDNIDHASTASDSSTKPQKLFSDQDKEVQIGLGSESSGSASIVNEVNVKIPSSPTDKMLPHLRPNDEFTAALLATSRQNQNTPTKDEQKETIIPPSDSILAMWLEHETTELEANVRGGYGRLSFNEFQQKMVKESIHDVLKVLDVGNEDENEMWNSTADLGRLSFLGNWLEMAKF